MKLKQYRLSSLDAFITELEKRFPGVKCYKRCNMNGGRDVKATYRGVQLKINLYNGLNPDYRTIWAKGNTDLSRWRQIKRAFQDGRQHPLAAYRYEHRDEFIAQIEHRFPQTYIRESQYSNYTACTIRSGKGETLIVCIYPRKPTTYSRVEDNCCEEDRAAKLVDYNDISTWRKFGRLMGYESGRES